MPRAGLRLRLLSLSLAAAAVASAQFALVGSAAPPARASSAVGEVEEGCPGQVHDSKTGVGRIGGADRYDVAAAVSRDAFAGGAAGVFIASGETFADALSASAAAGSIRKPVLLVTRDAIPPVIAAELTRLHPTAIQIVGGPNSVSAGVEAALKAFAPTVGRYGGADRYEVASTVATHTFNLGADSVYAASGAVFADALAGSAAAAARVGPMLLVGRDQLPPGAAVYLSSKPAKSVSLLGGTATVSDSVALQLGELARTNRVAGADRFDVAAAVSRRLFCVGTHTVYVASGMTFPDALSGAAAAATNGGPMLLVTRDTIPPSIADELRRLQPTRIVVLGGTASISDAVADQLTGFLAP
ncbi:cell wall-binding repeat-containing protein [Herbiconiux sp. 11R-BC]|uniref:cell wall-binding repeat-containing protein n=1 Tax=Herbiconiux sp. 11R-BC TaxID=3111637 RepID=UPI003BFDB8C0